MKRLKEFLKTTVLGGVAAVLPLAIVIFLFRWLVIKVYDILEPIASYALEKLFLEGRTAEIIVYVISFFSILGIFFFIGLVIRTRIGIFLKSSFETQYLMKIPGYKTARELVMQFTGKNRTFFSAVVIVDVFNTGTLMTGFVTDRTEKYISVFVPTGPNPTSGNIFHVKKEFVYETNTPVEEAMKSIISCGSGSAPFLKMAETKMGTEK